MAVHIQSKISNDIALQLNSLGAAIIEEMDYGLSSDCYQTLLNYFAGLPKDQYGSGERKRAYVRLSHNVETRITARAENQIYSQTYSANDMNGDEPRRFSTVPTDVCENGPLSSIIHRQLKLIHDLYIFKKEIITLGLHTVRYVARKGFPTYSSPIMFHRDDEPVVCLTVVSKSPHLVGGDTLLARSKKAIDRSVSLEPFQMALLSKQTLHMVTPMESSKSNEPAWRDIILLTVEEADEQVVRKTS